MNTEHCPHCDAENPTGYERCACCGRPWESDSARVVAYLRRAVQLAERGSRAAHRRGAGHTETLAWASLCCAAEDRLRGATHVWIAS